MFTTSDIFILFFVTLGPLKAIGPFAELTQGTEPGFRRSVAWRATATATAIVLSVALLGSIVLARWHVSVPAIAITGGIILFYQALQIVMRPRPAAPPPPRETAGPSHPSLPIASFRLVIPAIVTAPGIAAITALVAIAKGDSLQEVITIVLLFVIMVLNLITFWCSDALLKHFPASILQVIGWIMAVLQAMLATEFIIKSLQTLGALPAVVP